MLNKKALKGIALAAAALLVGFSVQAQTARPPVTGEANDHTSAGAVKQPAPKAKNATGNINPGVVPPQVGEANDHTSPNAVEQPAPKAKARHAKSKKARVKAPVTGEANDHSSNGGTTDAAKAAHAASM